MKPASKHIKDLLVQEGLGTFAETASNKWSINIGSQPDKPDNCITIYDTPGSTVDKTFTGANHLYHSTFQVRVRSKVYLTAHEQCELIRTTLDQFTTKGRTDKLLVEFDGTVYDNIAMDDESIPLTQDEKRRHIFVVNGTAFRKDA